MSVIALTIYSVFFLRFFGLNTANGVLVCLFVCHNEFPCYQHRIPHVQMLMLFNIYVDFNCSPKSDLV